MNKGKVVHQNARAKGAFVRYGAADVLMRDELSLPVMIKLDHLFSRCFASSACPVYIINAAEQVLAVNRLVASSHNEIPVSLDQLVEDEESCQSARQFFALKKSMARQFCRLDSPRVPAGILLSPIPFEWRAEFNERLFVAMEARVGRDDRQKRAFAKHFGLTVAEADVALRLTDGFVPAEIAQERGVSLETVRTQIKNVKQKLRVDSIPRIASCALSYLTAASHLLAIDAGHEGINVPARGPNA